MCGPPPGVKVRLRLQLIAILVQEAVNKVKDAKEAQQAAVNQEHVEKSMQRTEGYMESQQQNLQNVAQQRSLLQIWLWGFLDVIFSCS